MYERSEVRRAAKAARKDAAAAATGSRALTALAAASAVGPVAWQGPRSVEDIFNLDDDDESNDSEGEAEDSALQLLLGLAAAP